MSEQECYKICAVKPNHAEYINPVAHIFTTTDLSILNVKERQRIPHHSCQINVPSHYTGKDF